MTWAPDEVYLKGLDFFDAVVAQVPGDAWPGPSPCTGWRALDVLGHVGIATEFGSELLEGGAPEWHPVDTPGDAVAGEPVQWWRSLAERARRAAAHVDLTAEVDSPAGRRSVAEGLSFPAIDLFVHGWDLARSAGLDVEIPAEAIDFAHTVLGRLPREQLRGPQVFGAEQPSPAQASHTETFIAWTGRDPAWRCP